MLGAFAMHVHVLACNLQWSAAQAAHACFGGAQLLTCYQSQCPPTQSRWRATAAASARSEGRGRALCVFWLIRVCWPDVASAPHVPSAITHSAVQVGQIACVMEPCLMAAAPPSLTPD